LCKKFADTFLDSDKEKLSELDVSKTLNFATKAHSKQQYLASLNMLGDKLGIKKHL
jgi:hypothetical protein